jgi:uncharacterized cupin superfamily protein
MDEITIEHNPSPAKLEVIGAYDWPLWSKEISEFPWQYQVKETCYLLEGEAIVTPNSGAAVTIKRGDLVSFPAGMECRWDIRRAVKKHYRFG